LYSSPNIIRVIKSRGVRLAEHVARMGEMKNAHAYGRIILEWMLYNRVENCGPDSSASGEGLVGALVNIVMNLPVP